MGSRAPPEEVFQDLPPFKRAYLEREIDTTMSLDEEGVSSSFAMEQAIEVEVYEQRRKSFIHKIVSTGPFGIFRTDFTNSNPKRIRRLKFKLALLGIGLCLVLIPSIIVAARKNKGTVSSSSNSALSPEEDNYLDIDLSFSYDETTDDDGQDMFNNETDSSSQDSLDDDEESDESIDYGSRTLDLQSFKKFSTMDPVRDLGLPNVTRTYDSSPSSRLAPLRSTNPGQAIPTNAWYQNFLLLKDDETPTVNTRAYTMPYVVDAIGPIPGLRLHTTKVVTSASEAIIAVDEPYAVTIGATSNDSSQEVSLDFGYSVLSTTDLGITLQWVCITFANALIF